MKKMEKMKNSFALLIVLSLITTAMVNMSPVSASPGPILRTMIRTPTGTWNATSINQYVPSNLVTVRITIESVSNLYGFEFQLKYNPAILTAQSAVLVTPPIGLFPAPPNTQIFSVINNNIGLVKYACILSAGQLPKSTIPARPLVDITFHVEPTLGATLLDLCSTKLTGSGGTLIPHEAKDAYFSDAGTKPVAIFTVSDTAPEWHEKITFDASSSYSLPAFPIVSYYWDFGDRTNATDTIVIKNYGKTGTYTVALTVTNTASLSDTATATITVAPRVADLYRKKAWPEHHNYSISADENSRYEWEGEWVVRKLQTLSAMVTNYGDTTVDVRAEFAIYYYPSGQLYRTVRTVGYTFDGVGEATLAPGESAVLQYDMVCTVYPPPLGTYMVKAHAIWWDTSLGIWVHGAVSKTFWMEILP